MLLFTAGLAQASLADLFCCFSDRNSANGRGPCNQDQYNSHQDIINGWMSGCQGLITGTQSVGTTSSPAQLWSCPGKDPSSTFARATGDCYMQCIPLEEIGTCAEDNQIMSMWSQFYNRFVC